MDEKMESENKHAARKSWELKKLIQQTPNRAPDLVVRKYPKRELRQWCKPGEAIMHSDLMADVRQEGEQLEAESE